MSNALYDAGRAGFLDGSISWSDDTIKIVLVDAADYTLSLSADDNLDDVTAAGRVATSAALTSKTSTAGVADAADVTLSSVTGDQAEYLVIYKDSGVESTSSLIAALDTATGLPVTPSGGDITVTWDSGSNKIFKL